MLLLSWPGPCMIPTSLDPRPYWPRLPVAGLVSSPDPTLSRGARGRGTRLTNSAHKNVTPPWKRVHEGGHYLLVNNARGDIIHPDTGVNYTQTNDSAVAILTCILQLPSMQGLDSDALLKDRITGVLNQ